MNFAMSSNLLFMLHICGLKDTITIVCSALMALIIVFALWRAYRFTLLPLILKEQPKEVPYWIPFLGHGISFLRDASGTVTRGRHFFYNTREPFFLNLAGMKYCFITSPGDAASIHKSPGVFSNDHFLYEIMYHMGVSRTAIATLWRDPIPDANRRTTFQSKKLAHRLLGILKQQLSPGNSANIQSKILEQVYELTFWENMPKEAIVCHDSPYRVVSLEQWTRRVLVVGLTKAFFGEAFLSVNPDFLDHFFAFDDMSWMLIFKIPKFWSRGMHDAITRTQSALREYFSSAKGGRQDAGSLVDAMEKEMQQSGIEPQDIAAFVMLIYWGSNANAWKVCFWVLGHLIHNPALLCQIRTEEVLPVVNDISSSALSPVELAANLKTSCPKLMSIYSEVLRTTASSGSVRKVTRDTMLGSKRLTAGTDIVIPYRENFYDDGVFADPQMFKWDRFLGAEGEELLKSHSYRPFGGGVGFCPGRFLSQAEIFTFLAMVIGRYDLELEDKSAALPVVETGKPSLGVMRAKGDKDLLVNIKKINRERRD